MKKLLLILCLLMLTSCTTSPKNNTKVMKDFVDAEKVMIYFRSSSDLGSEVNLRSFRYPAKVNIGTNIKDGPEDKFNAEVNALTTKLNKNIFDIMQASLLEKADEASFDENKVLLFLKNLDNEGLIYFYSDGNVKEICANGARKYYYLNSDDHSLLNSLIIEYVNQVSDLQQKYLDKL